MRLLVAAVLLYGVAGCQPASEGDTRLETRKDSISYSIGMSVGKNLLRDSIHVNKDAFLRGLLDANADSAMRLMTDDQVQSTMMAFQDSLRRKQMADARATSDKNKMEGEAFLAENSKKEGVVTLPSGLQYRVLNEGTGKTPTAKSQVSVHYSGKLLDGTEFDSSLKVGKPATFQVDGVITGWTEALLLMKEGSKWELYIPSSLAYGEQGAGGVIPPNATLVFDVLLISVQ
jgi:FKBP-type peptidyl-prolyl cis-trans isomerase FklB